MSQQCAGDYVNQLHSYVLGLTHYNVKGSDLVQLQPIVYKLKELTEQHHYESCAKCEERWDDN